MPATGTTAVSLGYRDVDLPDTLDAPSCAVPSVERRAMRSCTVASRHYSGRAPEGTTLLRVVLSKAPADDIEAVQTARSELADILGIDATPLLPRVHRWQGVMPHHTIGHRARIEQIRQRLSTWPGLAASRAAPSTVPASQTASTPGTKPQNRSSRRPKQVSVPADEAAVRAAVPQWSPDLVHNILRRARQVTVATGETVFERGNRPGGIFVVLDGQIKLEVCHQDKKRVLEVIGPGHPLAEAAALVDQTCPVTASALTPSTLLFVDAETAAALPEEDVTFNHWMLACMARRLCALIAGAEAVALKPSVKRVADYLVHLTGAPSATGPFACITLPTTKRVLASRLSLTVETLSRALDDPVEAGLIDVNGRVITVTDLHGLRSIARIDQTPAAHAFDPTPAMLPWHAPGHKTD